MALKDVLYHEDYRTGYNDLTEEFFRPSLRQARDYWRAVGYFSSSCLESFGSPLGDFIRNDGRIRLVTSVELTPVDLDAITRGADKQEICEERLEAILDEEFADGVGTGVARLVRLLQLGRLEIKIAVPKDGTGIYHEKIGLFFDDHDSVAFTGSSNESRSALERNRECIDVYTSWETPSRAERKKQHFEALWEGRDLGVDTFRLPEAIAQRLLRVADSGRDSADPATPPDIWRHQTEAVDTFLAAERGILDMATGTGKTQTALRVMAKLFESGRISTAIVSMDGNDLLRQWYGVLLRTSRDLSRPARVYRDYEGIKEIQEFASASGNRILLVTRQGSGQRNALAAALRSLGSAARTTLLVHDEVHGLGSPGNRSELQGLSDAVRYRLGLSATPDRDYDDDGNLFVEEHIGPTLVTFQLEDAIRRGILAPFNYHPLDYAPSDDDRRRLREVHARRAARKAAGEPMSDTEFYIEIAKVHKTSVAKIPVFGDFIGARRELLERCIIFVEEQEYGRQVLEYVHRYRPDFHTYFGGEDAGVLSRFAKGDLQCLIACHRLSEGIDIRSLNTVILFASARARLETIQRIGRCLRSDPGNTQKVANIVDFIRSDGSGTPNPDTNRAAWLTSLSQIRAEGS